MPLQRFASVYRSDLADSVIPFWLKHSPDRECGGYFTCLDRDGSVYDPKKYMWLQGREVHMFSRLYNEFDRRPEFLDTAKLGLDFIRKFGKDAKGRVYFSLTREGKPYFFQRKIYGAVFYMMGLLEYSKATGDVACREEAIATFWDITRWMADPTLIDRPAMAGALHVSNLAGVMVLASMVIELSKVHDDPRYEDICQKAIQGLRAHFDAKRRILMENVSVDGSDISMHPEGRWFNPGHSIEVAWFLIHLLERLKRLQANSSQIGTGSVSSAVPVPISKDDNAAAIRLALDVLEGSLELGWDKEFGGLFYFMDVEGKPTLQLESSMKLWWPHTEAIYALVLAYQMTKDKRWLAWLEKVHEYSYSHFVDREMGDWFGYCDRQGNLTHTCKGGNYKGFFHVPRFLLMGIQAIEGKIDF